MGVVDDPVEDGIGEGWLADQVAPAVDRDLTGDQGGAAAVMVLDDLKYVVALLGPERFETQSSRINSLTPPSARIRRG